MVRPPPRLCTATGANGRKNSLRFAPAVFYCLAIKRTYPDAPLSPLARRPGRRAGKAVAAGLFLSLPWRKAGGCGTMGHGRLWRPQRRREPCPGACFGPASCGAQFAAARPAGRSHPGGNSAAPPGKNLPRGLGLFSPEAKTDESAGPARQDRCFCLPVRLPERSFCPCCCPNRSAWRAAP